MLIVRGNKKIGFEFKYADAPKLTRSMPSAQSDLAIDALYVVHPSEQAYPLSPQATVFLSRPPPSSTSKTTLTTPSNPQSAIGQSPLP